MKRSWRVHAFQISEEFNQRKRENIDGSDPLVDMSHELADMASTISASAADQLHEYQRPGPGPKQPNQMAENRYTPQRAHPRLRRFPLILTACICFQSASAPHAAEPKSGSTTQPGLVLTVQSPESAQKDVTTSPNVALYVESGQSPTPFTPPGPFTATWDGTINADLRGRFKFQAELNGTLKIEINGAVILESTGHGAATPLTERVRLNKGPNLFKATFSTPKTGDAFVRLAWAERSDFSSPIPNTRFSHRNRTQLADGIRLRHGRELFLNLRCIRCHTDATLDAHGVPELRMDAPSFIGIGTRRHRNWLTQWILDPRKIRPSAHMPRLLHGTTAGQEAEAIAAFLSTLKPGSTTSSATNEYRTRQKTVEDAELTTTTGKPAPLQERLHCQGCHNHPSLPDPDPTKLSLENVADKFVPGKLAEFLQAPERHYAWTRMPNFHLTVNEARELEQWLVGGNSNNTTPTPATVKPDLVATGQHLIQAKGCLHCHDIGRKLSTSPRSEPPDPRPLDQLVTITKATSAAKTQSAQGCLGEAPLVNYGLKPQEREALIVFLNRGRASLARHVPTEFASRQLRQLNCAACHGQIELVSPAERLGRKLKPEWAAKFIGGAVPHKVRYDAHPMGQPWLEARMPAFKSRANWLAKGMAAITGYGPISPTEPPLDHALAKIGQQLVGRDGGFSCTACHAIGPQLALEVFESEGVNFFYSADRLRPDFYRRWMRSPTTIDPQTQMPVYFEDDFSPLTEILDGKPEAQISAIWEYLKLRSKMTPP